MYWQLLLARFLDTCKKDAMPAEWLAADAQSASSAYVVGRQSWLCSLDGAEPSDSRSDSTH